MSILEGRKVFRSEVSAYYYFKSNSVFSDFLTKLTAPRYQEYIGLGVGRGLESFVSFNITE